jgi:hypothetical protein
MKTMTQLSDAVNQTFPSRDQPKRLPAGKRQFGKIVTFPFTSRQRGSALLGA